MPAASWKGSIRIGLVNVPVKATAVDRETKFLFNLHHAEDGGRLRSNPAGSICELDGEPVPADQVVRGYKGVAGVDDEYLKSLRKEKTDVVEIDRLVPEIPERWFRRSYDLVAEKAGAKSYALIADVLAERERVGLGKLVSGGVEYLVAVRPVFVDDRQILELELLWWPEEMKGTEVESLKAIEDVVTSDKERALAHRLFEVMEDEFDPALYVNETWEATTTYLEAFVAGKEPVKAAPVLVQAPAEFSLEDALSMSLSALGESKKPDKKAAKKPAKKKVA